MILGKLAIPAQVLDVDGKYQSAVQANEYIYVSHDYGNTWLQKDSIRQWWDIAVSGTGQYQVAVVLSGLIYVSHDYGVTWNPKGTTQAYITVQISKSGQFMVASTNSYALYASNDYGNTWFTLATAIGNTLGISQYDGQYQLTFSQGSTGIKKSSDYGASWISASISGIREIVGYPSLSASGQYQIFGTLYEFNNRGIIYRVPRIYYSQDFGATFNYYTNHPGLGSHTSSWVLHTAINSAGNCQIIGYTRAGGSAITEDYGVSWRSASVGIYAVAMSGSGRYITTCGPSGLYVSEDYGYTWTLINSGYAFRKVAINKYDE